MHLPFARLLAGPAGLIPIVAALLATVPAARADGLRLEAVKAALAPKIDGELSDDVWKQPPAATGFMRETRPPTEDTYLRMAYDAGALYFAFECPDSHAGQIQGQQKKRNGKLDQDDWVAVGIDPLGDRRTMYWFQVNAAGTQAEEIPGGAAAKIEWRGDWRAAAKIDEHGWTAEMAIPFAILKYPPGQRQFGLVFRRNLARIGEETCWPAGTSYYSHEHEATLAGVEAPRQRAVPRFMPYALVGAGGSLRNSTGIDIKYTAPNNITNLVTIRPDFQTIEDVIQTIDFSYNPRSLPDRRPFFTEGGSYFGDRFMFYSRKIGEIDAGAKSFGKIGRLGFGAMGTYKSGGDNNLLLNATYDVTPLSDIQLAVVQHDGTRNNRVLKLSASWRRPVNPGGYYWGFSAYQSQGGGPGATATKAYVDRYAGWGLLGWHLYYNRIPKEYDPALAFVPEKDKESVGGSMDYGLEYHKGVLLNWNVWLDYRYARHLDGSLFYAGVQPGLILTFRRSWSLALSYDLTNRPPNHDRVAALDLGLKIRDIYRATRLGLRAGRLDGGLYRFASLNQGFRLTGRFSLGLSLERLSLNYSDARDDLNVTQGVVSGVYDITPERGVVFRLVGNHQGANGYAAYRQELRRGTDIFFIVGDPNAVTFRPRIGLKVVNTY